MTSILKNTSYNSFNAPPLGPNTKTLKHDIKTINDGILLVKDAFAADQYKKIEKGLDLLLNNANGASESNLIFHHISVIISGYADLNIPKSMYCLLEFNDVTTNYMPIQFRNVLRSFDASLIYRIESNYNSFNKIFSHHLSDVRENIPNILPKTKVNTYIMLLTAMRTYNDLFTPLFKIELEKYIEEWLCSQERDAHALDDLICSEYGKILNQKIDEGYFRFTPKKELTPFDKGTNTIIVDRKERRIYIETEVNEDIAKNDMQAISDTDSLTTALNNEGYLHINVHNSKCHRLHTIDSDGNPHPLYSHSIKYSLINNQNKDRFELIDKDMYLYEYDELPYANFLPLIQTINGRFAGKMLVYEAEESNHYFGTGKTGSGKSWALAQLIPMLFMLGHTVVVFDVSGTYTREKLYKMLPKEVVDILFQFINVGVKNGQDKIPVNLGSLKGCDSLPDKKRAIYNVIRAAIVSIDKGIERMLKGLLSVYLNDKKESVNFNDLCSYFESKGPIGSEVPEMLRSVLDDINAIGFEDQTWDKLFQKHNRMIVINLGNEVGDITHQLLDMLVASLFNWQMLHDKRFLDIAIDELKDQDFSKGSPLSTIVSQGRKFHTALLGATQDYFNQGSSCLDVMKQANIKSFGRPGKSEDRIAQMLGYKNAVDAGFHKFRSCDKVIEADFYNKVLGINEGSIIKGQVVNFVNTPFYEKFKNQYLNPDIPPNYYGNTR